MKYKVGCKVIAEQGKGQITKITRGLYLITWDDGIQYSCDETELEEDYKLKPKKKKNKLEKRVKELEKLYVLMNKRHINEITSLNELWKDDQNKLDDLDTKYKSIWKQTQAILDHLNGTGNNPVKDKYDAPDIVDDIISDPKDTETPNKKVINPDKTLKERLEELGCGIESCDIIDFNNMININFKLGEWYQSLCFECKTDDEIVEKVKQIIDILK